MVKKTILNNGIRLISEEIPEVNSATLGIWVKTGSRNEKLAENGISHFIEHLQFRGTAKYSSRDISEILEEFGGQINAFTTKEYTCYYIRVLYEYFYQALEVLMDMFFNSIYDTEDISRERGIIAEEIRSVEDTPDEIVHDYFAKAFWGEQPLGRPILGTIDTIAGFDRDIIMDYLHRQYVAGNIVISVCGKIRHQEVLDKIGPAFEKISKGKDSKPDPNQAHPSTIICSKPGEQVQICLGSLGIPHKDKNMYPLIVLNNILGGGLSSRLFQEIREDRGLVYSIYSYISSYFETGLWCVHAGTSSENVPEVLEVCFEIISEVKRCNVTESELKRTKQQIRGELLLSGESTTNHMSRLGKTEITYDRVISVEEMVEKITQVTREEIDGVSHLLFKPDNFSLAVVGPYEKDFCLSSVSSLNGLA